MRYLLKHSFLFAVFLSPFSVKAHQIKRDSPLLRLKITTTDTGKASLHTTIAIASRANEPDRAQSYAKAAFALALKINYKKGCPAALNNWGNIRQTAISSESTYHWVRKHPCLRIFYLEELPPKA